MTWQSIYQPHRVYDELDISDEVGGYDYQSLNNKKMSINWHQVKMWVLLGLAFIVGGLSALKGNGMGDFTTLITVLIMAEHALNEATTTQ